MTNFLIRRRFWALGLAIALLLGLIAAGRRVDYEQSIKSFFADDDPAIALYRRASAEFGDDNFVFLAYEDPNLLTTSGLRRVASLAAAVGPSEISGVERVESLDAMPLFWKIDDALIALQSMPKVLRNAAIRSVRDNIGRLSGPSNPFTIAGAIGEGDQTAQDALRAKILHHPLLVGTLIDLKGTTTAVVVRLKRTNEHFVQETVRTLRAKADAFAARNRLDRPAVVGPPVLLADGFDAIERDGRRLAAVGMALIGLVTLAATRSVWWALVPILSGWLVWLGTEWVLATFHLKLSLSGGPLVAQIIVMTMPAASHLAVHYQEERRNRGTSLEAARMSLRGVCTPILWTAATGAIGYGALLTSSVVPIQQFGAIMGTCTLAAGILTMALAPSAMMPPFRFTIATPPTSPDSSSPSRMTRLTDWVQRYPRRIVLGVLAVVIPITTGIGRLGYESNYINAFQPETRVVRDYGFVESRLGGIGVVEVVVPVPAELTPETLSKFKKLEAGIIGSGANEGRASSAISIATVLDPFGELSALGTVAGTEAIRTKIELIQASPQASLLEGFLSESGPERSGRPNSSRILVRLVEQQPTATKNAIFGRALTLARDVFGGDVYLTGLSFLMTKTTEGIISTQWATFLYSAAGILVMLTIALRGPVLACLAMIPTLLSVSLVLGLMGWLGIKLDMATALVASVALGLSVDDTFHCLLQFREARRSMSFAESLRTSYSVSGPGVLLSSFAVAIGFLALRLSEFAPFVNFGTMVGIATAGSTIGNVLLLPAMLTLGEHLSRRMARVAG